MKTNSVRMVGEHVGIIRRLSGTENVGFYNKFTIVRTLFISIGDSVFDLDSKMSVLDLEKAWHS